jgi:hypothetical protein
MTHWSRESAASHVVKRMKAIVKRDTRHNMFWLEDQATKQQISPEFSSYDCMVNWLIYEGFTSFFLEVESFIGWDKTRRWRLEQR